ncbi:MAG TPA: efflux RND transporter periplasmic adaptor subunit [Kofleriaceae bacterium]|nr:efflux RND transporter periplasmic adaptor subunit [Kofleriaceae bacterium]
MITPLKPRHHHGGIVALVVLVAAIAVVWLTRTADRPKRAHYSSAASSVVAPRNKEAVPRVLPHEPGLATFAVAERPLRTHVTGTGVTEYNAERTSLVATPVAGYLKKTRASWLGRKVRAGEVLAVVYSAEVFAATADVVEQVKNFESQTELDRARNRLLRWGMPRETLVRVERGGVPYPILTLASWYNGTVVAEQGPPRGFIESDGEVLFTITDPSYLSVFVALPAADAARIAIGATGQLTIEGVQKPVTAKVVYVARRAEEGMRKVQFDFQSPKIKIAPDKKVTAAIDVPPGGGPVVPESAVLRVGNRTVVYAARDEIMEARDVKLGALEDGAYRVEEGVAVGETVALRVSDLVKR